MKALHAINGPRLRYIEQHVALAGLTVADIGCGGGLLSEAMARRGARVTGLDLAGPPLQAAREHAREQPSLEIAYVQGAPEEYAKRHAGRFDAAVCMELLEHVSDPEAIVTACARLIRPGGTLFFSTLNRRPKSYLLAVLAAEYLCGLLPMGTHDYRNFLRPSELTAMVRRQGLQARSIRGLGYLPFVNRAFLADRPDINYLLCAQRPEATA